MQLFVLLTVLWLGTRGPTDPGPAIADPVQVDWQAPTDCPDREVVVQRTEQILGRALSDARHPEVHAAVTITGKVGQYSASLRLRTRAGQHLRRVSGQTCETLVDAIALLLAMAIDPTAHLAPPPPDNPQAPEPPPEPPQPLPQPPAQPPADKAPPPAHADPPPQRPPSQPPLRRRNQLSGALGIGLALQPGGDLHFLLGASGWGGLVWPRLLLMVSGNFAATPVALSAADGVRVSMRRGHGEVRVCARFLRNRATLLACGGGFAGAMRAAASGLTGPGHVRLPWAGPLVGLGLRYAFRPKVALAFDVSALISALRPQFTAEGLGVIHRAYPVSALATLGVEFALP